MSTAPMITAQEAKANALRARAKDRTGEARDIIEAAIRTASDAGERTTWVEGVTLSQAQDVLKGLGYGYQSRAIENASGVLVTW